MSTSVRADLELSGLSNKDVIISTRNVTKEYKSKLQRLSVIKNVNLEIKKGQVIAITGPSGSGKSTLLHIIGCIDRPTSGQLLVDGIDVSRLSDRRLSKIRQSKVGFVFQSFYLQPFLRLKDNVAVPAMFAHRKNKDFDEKVSSLLDKVGLSDRADHYPSQLSGGQIQRAAIARALVNSPSLIIADEPTGNLDSQSSQTVIELFKSVRETLGTTVIIATHDHAIASQCDRVIHIKDGVIE